MITGYLIAAILFGVFSLIMLVTLFIMYLGGKTSPEGYFFTYIILFFFLGISALTLRNHFIETGQLVKQPPLTKEQQQELKQYKDSLKILCGQVAQCLLYINNDMQYYHIHAYTWHAVIWRDVCEIVAGCLSDVCRISLGHGSVVAMAWSGSALATRPVFISKTVLAIRNKS